MHGFLPSRDGTHTTFDPPRSAYTVPTSINSEGAITGYYANSPVGSPVTHAFFGRDGGIERGDRKTCERRVRKSGQKEAAGAADARVIHIEWSERGL